MQKKSSIHQGHRQRLKQAMLKSNFQGISDINLLEAVLFYSIARSDTNEIAHALLGAFGSLQAVFEADYEDLLQVPGVGENSAFLIKLMSKSAQRLHMVDTAKAVYITNSAQAAEVVKPYFIGEKDEKILALFLDGTGKLIRVMVLGEGVVNSVSFDNRKLMEGAIRTNCTTVILAHNHPHGVPNASSDDLRLTHSAREMLRTIDVCLFDHLIYAEGHWHCFSERDDAAKYLSILEMKKKSRG